MANEALPKELVLTDRWEIAERGTERILLSPSKCYLDDEVVNLKAVIEEIVKRYNFKPKLYQLHRQSKINGELEFVAQSGEIYTQHDMGWWIEQIQQDHPLPSNCQWFLCNEESEHFLRTYADPTMAGHEPLPR